MHIERERRLVSIKDNFTRVRELLGLPLYGTNARNWSFLDSSLLELNTSGSPDNQSGD